MHTVNVKSLLITGIGGTRIDFVAGWLGQLPKFVDTNWSIDPATGWSKGDINLTKCLDKDQSLNLIDCLGQYQFKLTNDAEYTLATTCHGIHLDNQLTNCKFDAYQIAYINFNEADQDQILWNFLVKTYLTEKRNRSSISQNFQYNIDHQGDLSDDIKVQKIINIFKNVKKYMANVNPAKSTQIILDYDQLFVPGGSRYLTEQLKITTTGDRHHLFWDMVLPIIDSPDEIYQFGYLWKKSDFL